MAQPSLYGEQTQEIAWVEGGKTLNYLTFGRNVFCEGVGGCGKRPAVQHSRWCAS